MPVSEPSTIIPADELSEHPMHPTVISMQVDDDDTFESEYRLRVRNLVPVPPLLNLPWSDE
jgi:hypothetical protein